MTADSHCIKPYFKRGTCPCRCGRSVPSGAYWATPACGRKANQKNKQMPKRYEKKLRYKRST